MFFGMPEDILSRITRREGFGQDSPIEVAGEPFESIWPMYFIIGSGELNPVGNRAGTNMVLADNEPGHDLVIKESRQKKYPKKDRSAMDQSGIYVYTFCTNLKFIWLFLCLRMFS